LDLTRRLFIVTSNLVISTKSFWIDSRFPLGVNLNDTRETILHRSCSMKPLIYWKAIVYWYEPRVDDIASGATVASDKAWARPSYLLCIWPRVFSIWVTILRCRNTGTWWNYHKVTSKTSPAHKTKLWWRHCCSAIWHYRLIGIQGAQKKLVFQLVEVSPTRFHEVHPVGRLGLQ